MTRALAIASVVLLLVAVGLGFAWRHERAAAAEAQRRAQAEQLKASGLLVAAQASAGDLAAAAARVPGLEAELAKARAAAPGIRTVYVDRLVTAPIVAGGEPRPTPAQPSPGSTSPPGGGPLPPCLLAPGDRGELRATVVGLETTLGNRVVVGTAEAWRLEPGPPTRLLAGPFSAPLSSAAAEPSTHRAPEERVWWLGGWAEWDPTNLQGTPEYALELDRQLLQFGPVDLAAFAYLGRFYDGRDAAGRQAFTTQARAGVRAGWSF